VTKKQRKAKARRAGARTRKARAVSQFMKKMNPAKAKKGFGYKVKRLLSGGFSIVPVKLGKGKR
jgi:hypothetical protein